MSDELKSEIREKLKKSQKKKKASAKKMSISTEKVILVFLVLTAAVLLIYFSSFPKEFTFKDISNLDNLSSPHTFSEIFDSMKIKTRVLANLSFALNYYFSKDNVTSYYIVNVLMHILNSFLIFILTLKILTLNIFFGTDIKIDSDGEYYSISITDDDIESGKTGFEDNARLAAFVTAIVFAVHPTAIYATTFIAQRATLLCSFFYLASMITFINYLSAKSEEYADKNLYMSIIFAILALLSKETAVTILPVFFVFEVFMFDERGDLLKKKATVYLTMLLIVELVFILLPYGIFKAAYLEGDTGFYTRLITQLRVFFFYGSVLLFPAPDRLSIEYDILNSTSLMQPVSTLISLVAVVMLIIVAFANSKRLPLMSFLILWYFLNLSVEAVLPVKSVSLERVYLTSYTILFALGYIFMYLYKKTKAGLKAFNYALILLFCTVTILLSFIAVKENRVFATSVTLFEDAYKTSPESAGILYKLGMAYRDAGDYLKGEEYLGKVIEIDGDNARAHYDFATVNFELKRYARAEEHYKKTKMIDPDYIDAFLGLSELYLRVGRKDMAEKELVKAVMIEPDNVTIHSKLADIYLKTGDLVSVIRHLNRAIALDGDNPDLHYRVARVYDVVGDVKSALKEFEIVLDLDPDFEPNEEIHLKIKELIEKY